MFSSPLAYLRVGMHAVEVESRKSGATYESDKLQSGRTNLRGMTEQSMWPPG